MQLVGGECGARSEWEGGMMRDVRKLIPIGTIESHTANSLPSDFTRPSHVHGIVVHAVHVPQRHVIIVVQLIVAFPFHGGGIAFRV